MNGVITKHLFGNFKKSMIMRKTLFCFVLIILVIRIKSFAQDPQFSQFYNSPLYLNPAYAGTGDNTRAVFNFRSQWPSISRPTSYVTMAAGIDHNIEPLNSGVGLLILRDRQGKGNLSTTEISGIYSYQLDLTKNWSFRPALQGGVVIRNIDYSRLTFGDQLTPNGPTGDLTSDGIAANNNVVYPDISTGGVFFNDQIWIGLSAHHINRPNQAFTGERFPLPVKFSFQSGMKISLGSQSVRRGYTQVNKERSIVPTFLYKSQGKFDQLDLGFYFINEPVMFGVWYRGIPIKNYNGYVNNESFIFLAGIQYERMTFAYSYDLTVSKLSLMNSGGAHEISLIYEWRVPYKTKKSNRPLPCPYFYKRKNINLDKMDKK